MPVQSTGRSTFAGAQATWTAVMLLLLLSVGPVLASTEPNPDPHSRQFPAATDHGPPAPQKQQLSPSPESAQQAYERALSLLRTTIKSKPRPVKHSGTSAKDASSTSKHPSSSGSESSNGATAARAQPSKVRISWWDLVIRWTPFGSLYRVMLALAESLGLRSPLSVHSNSLSVPSRSNHHSTGARSYFSPSSSSSSSSPNSKWLGPPIGATRDELRWQGARPLALWPDWENLGHGLAPLNGEDSPWDSVMFGPFQAGWEADEEDDGDRETSVLQDVTIEADEHRDTTGPSIWQHPAVPAALRTSIEAGRKRTQSLFNVRAPWSQAKRIRREAIRGEMERRRGEAIGLLEWAGWGRKGVDWEHEAYAAESSISVLADLLDQSAAAADGRSDRSNSTTTSIQAHADALWVLAEHSLWGTHGAAPNIARARACYQRLADFGQSASGTSRAGNASAHARLAFLEGSGWEPTIRQQWIPPTSTDLAAASGGSDRDLREAWKRRRESFARLKRDDGLRQAKSLLHYSQAAAAGDAPSQMALGFRYRAGIGVKPTCTEALAWYEKAAQDAYRRFQTGPPGGLTIPYSKLRLSDLDGGAYGPGASAASTGLAALKPAVQAALNRQPGSGVDSNGLEDMLEYHIYHAERGDARFMLLLARVYYQGSIWAPSDAAGAVRRDYKKSMSYLLRITRNVWPKDAALVGRGGPTGWIAKKGDKGEDVQLKVDDQRLLAQAGSAASLIARMYLRGEGVRQDFARAWVWYSRGVDTGDGDAYNGLGMMLRDELGVPRDMSQAVTYFEASAKARSLEGTINLAKVHIDMGDYPSAIKSLDLAIRASNSFEAYYLMATINARLARSQNSLDRCRLAVAGFKQTAERGDWAAPMFHKAERAWRRGRKHKALLGWALAGEMGYEAAQNNVAYILDRDKRRLRLSSLDSDRRNNSTDRLALVHWTRSAGQDNVDAMVKMGDYYFHGIGTRNPGRPAYDKAAACYSAAADRQVSALAYWNMGWLYETGLGVARQDFHLAKRYYDMAVEINEEAYLPVMLSLIKLHLRALWATLIRGEASDSAMSLFSSYTSAQDAGDAAYTEAEEMVVRHRQRLEQERRQRAQGAGEDDYDEPEDYGGDAGARGDVDPTEQGNGLGDPSEPETWHSDPGRNPKGGAKPKRRAPSSLREAAGGGPADDEDGWHGDGEEDVDDLLEGGLLVLALGLLAYLAYVRQGVQIRIGRERREREQAAGAANGNGDGDGNGDGQGNGDAERDEEDRRGAAGPVAPFPWAAEGGGANHLAGV